MTASPAFSPFLEQALRRGPQRPWPRVDLDRDGWQALLSALRARPAWSLLGLWGEPGRIHLALRDETEGSIGTFSLAAPDGRYPAVSPARASAQRLERAGHDLFGLVAEGASDDRPWLDHGRWPLTQPLAAQPGSSPAAPQDYRFLPAEGEGLHQIPVGPVHAGIIEPGHFRFHATGETVVRLEARLGYVHKGIEGLMAGKTPAEAARLAARVSGDSTVAHSLAFARAIEAALDLEPSPRANNLRALMAELERIANHLFDIGAICNDATFPLLLAELTRLREAVLQANQESFGHRLLMDRVVPGGVAVDLDAAAERRIGALVAQLRPAFAHLMRIYDSKPSLLDRMVQTGVVKSALVRSSARAAMSAAPRAAGRTRGAIPAIRLTPISNSSCRY